MFYKECSIESCCENSSLECDIFPSTSGAVMAPFNNVSVILWWLVLLVKETGVPEKKRGVLNTILCDKVFNDLRQVGGFFSGTPVSFTNKTNHHNITETLDRL
jgi:hypothetical protein